jgi:hypothetical protein
MSLALLGGEVAKDQKSRVRVFFGEIEGNNETIRDGLRSIASAVNRTFQPTTSIIKVVTTKGDLNDQELLEHIEKQNAKESADDGQEPTALDTDLTKPAKSGGRRPRKPPSYSLVKELNLRPDGKPSLRDFFAEKQPPSQQEELTVILYYLCKILETPQATPRGLVK